MALSIPYISIHAPREGGDDQVGDNFNQRFISIHAPREGGDEEMEPFTVYD